MEIDALVDPSIIHQLTALRDRPPQELWEVVRQRYGLASDLLDETARTYFAHIAGTQLSLGFDPAFGAVFDCAFEFMMDVDMKDTAWHTSVEVDSVIRFARPMFDRQQSFGRQADQIPREPTPRTILVPRIGALYMELCEGLLKMVFAKLASLGSVLKGERRPLSETSLMKTRTLSEYIRSINGGKYAPLVDSYDPVIRNAFGHMGVEYDPWSPSVTLRDEQNVQSMTAEDLCRRVYALKQSLDQVIMAAQLYALARDGDDSLQELKKVPVTEVAKMLFEGSRFDPDVEPAFFPFTRMDVERVDFTAEKGLIIHLSGPRVTRGAERDWVIRGFTWCWRRCILFMVDALKMEISTLSVTVRDNKRRILGKQVATIAALQTMLAGLTPARPPVFIPGPKRTR